MVTAPDGNAVKAIRLDKWLWAARFFKTRRLASEAIKGGKVTVDGVKAKPAKEVRIGQSVHVSKGAVELRVNVDALSNKRGPATEAQALYTETPESLERRERLRARQRETAATIPRLDRRPERRDRRQLAAFKRGRGDGHLS